MGCWQGTDVTSVTRPFGDGGVGFHGVLVDRRKVYSPSTTIRRGKDGLDIAAGEGVVIADVPGSSESPSRGRARSGAW